MATTSTNAIDEAVKLKQKATMATASKEVASEKLRQDQAKNAARRAKARERKARSRARQTPAQREEERTKAREAMAKMRRNATDEQKAKIRANSAAGMRRYRAKLKRLREARRQEEADASADKGDDTMMKSQQEPIKEEHIKGMGKKKAKIKKGSDPLKKRTPNRGDDTVAKEVSVDEEKSGGSVELVIDGALAAKEVSADEETSSNDSVDLVIDGTGLSDDSSDGVADLFDEELVPLDNLEWDMPPLSM